MKLPLETLLQSIGQAVQQAQTGMEIGAEQLYWQTWQQSDDSAGTCRPICRRLEIPMGPGQEPRILELPVTALYHHQPMALDTVQIRLRFMPQAGEQGLELELEPTPKGDTASELTLTLSAAGIPGRDGPGGYPCSQTLVIKEEYYGTDFPSECHRNR